ncbi:MAG: hypothetical protein JWN14_3055 [Chthonomonadales bacterium]|nr:hypothetical protein [Chthonomonadales bacterium]
MDHEAHVDRRTFLATATGGLLTLPLAASAGETGGTSQAAPRPEEPLTVSDRKQLFIDRRFIDSSENVALVMNPAQKLGIVLDSTREPWELGTGGFFRVIEDRGKFKMYYGAFTEAGKSLCYAESLDGLHWTKPSLGLVTVRGAKNNNIIYADNAIDATIMIDPQDVQERRYKLFRSNLSDDLKVGGVYASYSADGIHFTEAGRVFPMWPETSLIADWDPRIRKYVVFTRVFVRNHENQRRIARLEMDDLLKPWPHNPQAPLLSPPAPENIPLVLATDAQDNPFCDFYTNAAHIYSPAEDVYLMFPAPFRHFAPSPGRQPWFRFEPGNDYGLIEVQMAVSRDGIHWSRPDRRPYFPMGLPDEWDRWVNMMGSGIVRQGNSLYQYYWSSGRGHDGGILRKEYDNSIPTKSAYGAVRQRLDGFMSADFAYTGGTLSTPLLRFSGTHLQFNIDSGGMGTAFVEIRDAHGQPIPGFTYAESEEIGGNFLDTTARWKGKSDLTALRGKPIRLHLKARGAKLYAFQFPSGPAPT